MNVKNVLNSAKFATMKPNAFPALMDILFFRIKNVQFVLLMAFLLTKKTTVFNAIIPAWSVRKKVTMNVLFVKQISTLAKKTNAFNAILKTNTSSKKAKNVENAICPAKNATMRKILSVLNVRLTFTFFLIKHVKNAQYN